MIWKSLMTFYISPDESHKKFTINISKVYSFLKEILIIFYEAHYSHHFCSIDLSNYSLNLSAFSLNHQFYEETVYLTRFFNWILLINDQNFSMNNMGINEEIQKWMKGGVVGLGLNEFEIKILENRGFEEGNGNFITNFVRRVKALIFVKGEEEIEQVFLMILLIIVNYFMNLLIILNLSKFYHEFMGFSKFMNFYWIFMTF